MRRASAATQVIDCAANAPIMPNTLQRILFSAATITAVCLFVLYLVSGFFVLPAVAKWQIETRVSEQLGHRISVRQVRFNPLAFKLEIGDLALFGSNDKPMMAFKRMTVNFELRSVIDRAWTFSEARLDAPVLRIALDKDGHHNFSALLDRLGSNEDTTESGALPRVIVDRVVLAGADVEYSDQLLAEPLIARIAPLQIEIDNLSTLPAQKARYRISARTAAGETLETDGDFALNPIVAAGKLTLSGLQVTTLVKSLSRVVVLDSLTGQIDFTAKFAFAVDSSGGVSGAAQELDLDVTALSVKAHGASRSMAAIQSLAIKQGRIDLDRREATFASLRIAKGNVAAVLDEHGQLDWAKIARVPAVAKSNGQTSATALPVSEPGAWRVSVANAESSEIAFTFSDTARRRSAKVAAIGLSMSATAEVGPQGTRVKLDHPKLSVTDVVLELASSNLVEQGAAPELARVSQASMGAQSLTLALPDGPIDVAGDGLTATLSDVVVRSPADATELLRLGTATLVGGALSLKDRAVTAQQLALTAGVVKTSFDAQGQLNWLSLVNAVSAPLPAELATPLPGPVTALADTQAPAAAWRISLESAELADFAIGFEDRRRSPALAIGLEAMRASVTGLDTGAEAPMKVDFQARVASGGQIGAQGSIRVDNWTSDLEVKLSAVSLVPAQTYLSELAALRLASATASANGRLRYDPDARAGAMLAYKGRIAVDGLLLEEVKPKRPFLAWKSAASGDVVLTLEPNRVDIGELRIDGPSARLVIAADQSVNLTDVLKKPQESATVSDASDSGPEPESDKNPFPVTVARVRVSGGELEFADLSLRPQFGARMHELNGVISGLGTDASRSAKLQLDARVDKYGSAKIRGQIRLHHPEQFTEIDMTFRNLEMTSLSPYVAKFAGYEIAAGRLALDLQYKVRDGKLRGENKIVLKQVELGKKVESPGALDLPLELAIAILKDSQGVIDIGLPIGGDLDDPSFDYGAVIGKAVGNLLGGIVTAPFRALGALFGAGDEKIGAIAFEPGSDVIAPPERQKLETVARALQEKPALQLVVPPAYAAEQDTAALKSLAVRTEIVRRMGIELTPGEDPGPIDTANPRVQRAVEAAFNERYASEVLPALKRRLVEAPPSAGPPIETGKSTAVVSPSSESKLDTLVASSAAAQPASVFPAFYQSLVDRLIAQEPVSEQMLTELAVRRGNAVMRELTTIRGLPVARVTLGEPHQVTDANETAVTMQLRLEVAQ